MRGLSKLKAWLKRKGFTSTNYKGDSEYYTLNGFSATVRLADHVGREGTETDKYINIIPDGVDRYVFIYDRISTSMSHKELIYMVRFPSISRTETLLRRDMKMLFPASNPI